MTDFDTVLAEIRRAAPSEAAKGAAFERLMRAYLLHAPKIRHLKLGTTNHGENMV